MEGILPYDITQGKVALARVRYKIALTLYLHVASPRIMIAPRLSTLIP